MSNDSNNTQYILEVHNLKKYFPIETNFFGKPTRYLHAVDDVSFNLKSGTTIGVVGESGCGKTTLGRTILRLYNTDGGQIIFDGDDITNLKRGQMQKYRTDIQLIFQDPYSSLPPRMTVGDIISEAVRVHNIVPRKKCATTCETSCISADCNRSTTTVTPTNSAAVNVSVSVLRAHWR